MSIQTELTRLTNAKAAIKTAIEGKGVTVPEGTLLDGMASLIESIETGGGEETLFGTYFETGSIIPASDITTDYTIQFQKNFSSIPGNISGPGYTFVLWCSIPPGYTSKTIPTGSLAWVFVGRKSKNAAMTYGQYVSVSGTMSNLISLSNIGTNDLDKFILKCKDSKKLVSGYVYNWIALAPSKEGYTT